MAYLRYYRFAPHIKQVPIPASVRQAIQEACDRASAALPEPPVGLQPTLILPFVNDREFLVTQTLAATLSPKGQYRAIEPGLLGRLFEKAGMQRLPITEPEQAIKLARSEKAEVVLIGAVEELRTQNKHSAHPEFSASNSYYVAGVLCFALFCQLLLAPVMKRVLHAENNALTVIALVLILTVPIVLGWPWAFGADTDMWKVIIFVLGATLIALWCTFVMSQVAEREPLYQ